MRNFLMWLLFFSMGTFMFTNSACSANLGGAKGKVIDALTGKPIAGVEVVATTSSNIESEQRYLKYSTKTGTDGSFLIKGIRNKDYQINILKQGYTSEKRIVTIPGESNLIIEKPIKLCFLPPSGGVFIYTVNAGEYFKLFDKHVESYSGEYSDSGDYSGKHTRDFYYFKAKELQDLRPLKPDYLVLRGKEFIETGDYKGYFVVYRLFRHSSQSQFNNESEEVEGDYYSIGPYKERHKGEASMFYPQRGVFTILNEGTSSVNSGENENNPNIAWGTLKGDIYGDAVVVVDIRNLRKGFYTVLSYKKYGYKGSSVINIER